MGGGGLGHPGTLERSRDGTACADSAASVCADVSSRKYDRLVFNKRRSRAGPPAGGARRAAPLSRRCAGGRGSRPACARAPACRRRTRLAAGRRPPARASGDHAARSRRPRARRAAGPPPTSWCRCRSWDPGQLARLAIDHAPGGLHRHAEAVAGQVLIAVGADAEHAVGRGVALDPQAFQDTLGAAQRDRIAVDQAHARVQHAKALGGQVAAEEVPQAFHGALALGLGDPAARVLDGVHAVRVGIARQLVRQIARQDLDRIAGIRAEHHLAWPSALGARARISSFSVAAYSVMTCQKSQVSDTMDTMPEG